MSLRLRCSSPVRERSTALNHDVCLESAPDREAHGSNSASSCQSSERSSRSPQTPSARPASVAAPNAVVSVFTGRDRRLELIGEKLQK